MAVKSLAQSSILQPSSTNSMLGDYESNYFHHLETVRLGGTAASVTFSNLDQYADYQHLQIRMVTRCTYNSASSDLIIRFNGDSGNNYSWHQTFGRGDGTYASNATTTTSASRAGQTAGNTESSGVFGAQILDINDAFKANKYKTLKCIGGVRGSGNYVHLISGSWRNLSPISSIQILDAYGGSIATGSKVALYGLKAKS